MPKGHKKELNLRDGLLETDRALTYAMRKNLGTAERLLNSPIEEAEKAELRTFLEGHPLARKTPPTPSPVSVPQVLTERERFLERVIRVLSGLSEPNLRNLYELAKSMGRVENTGEKNPPQRSKRRPMAANQGSGGLKEGNGPAAAEASVGG
jgi:hypothetical protein